MAHNVELSESADRELGKLDVPQAKRILKFLQRIAKLDDPRSIGEALHGSRLGEFWKYRVGDYRLICKIDDDRLVARSFVSDIAKKSIASDSVRRRPRCGLDFRRPNHGHTRKITERMRARTLRS